MFVYRQNFALKKHRSHLNPKRVLRRKLPDHPPDLPSHLIDTNPKMCLCLHTLYSHKRIVFFLENINIICLLEFSSRDEEQKGTQKKLCLKGPSPCPHSTYMWNTHMCEIDLCFLHISRSQPPPTMGGRGAVKCKWLTLLLPLSLGPIFRRREGGGGHRLLYDGIYNT